MFLLYFAGDWAGANWTVACNLRRPKCAGAWSLAYHLIHASAVVFIVKDPWCILSLASGGALGCYFAISRKKP